MKKLENSAIEPWIINVYGQNHKLLWVSEPSIGWVFLFGVGLLLTVVYFNLVASTSVSETLPTRETYDAPALQLD